MLYATHSLSWGAHLPFLDPPSNNPARHDRLLSTHFGPILALKTPAAMQRLLNPLLFFAASSSASTWTSVLNSGNVLYAGRTTDANACNYLQFKVTNTGSSATIAYAGLSATGDIVIDQEQPKVVAMGSVAAGAVT